MKASFVSVTEVNETAIDFICSRRKESVFGDLVYVNGHYVQNDAEVDGKIDIIYDLDPQTVINDMNTP